MRIFKLNGVLDWSLIVHGQVKAKSLKDAKAKFRKQFKGKITSVKEEI